MFGYFHSAFKCGDDPFAASVLAVFDGFFDRFTGRHTADQIRVGDSISTLGFIFCQFKICI